VTPRKVFEVPDVLDVHEVPSDEVRMVPDSPTATKVLFPLVIPLRIFEIPDVLDAHEVPSEEVRMVPEYPTATKVLFP
jgi:hypothetical protein